MNGALQVQRTKPLFSRITDLDPRGRIIFTVLFACCVVSLSSLYLLAGCCLVGLALLFSNGLSNSANIKKVMTMDGFIIFMLILLPFTTPGDALFSIAGFPASIEGLIKATEIILKANAVVLMLLALVGSLDPIVLGHALNRLKVPENLVHLMLFSVRYIDVLKMEYSRLRIAMKARCFRLQNSLHTYRSIGYLLGMMLVRSLERSERILEAMKCRGFQGKFYLLDDFHYRTRDFIFLGTGFIMLFGLLYLDRYYG